MMTIEQWIAVAQDVHERALVTPCIENREEPDFTRLVVPTEHGGYIALEQRLYDDRLEVSFVRDAGGRKWLAMMPVGTSPEMVARVVAAAVDEVDLW